MSDADKYSFITSIEEPAEPVIPRDSATVIVVRDVGKLEVFLMERHLQSDFAGGAYVFPGGTLDEGDKDPALADLVEGWQDLASHMGESDAAFARALAVCAIRETFEEAGILLARHEDGSPVKLDDPAWSSFRRALNAGEITAAAFAKETSIRFAADLLRFWQRWVTPVFAPRRYDARFFVTVMPDGQSPLHDDVETTASAWVPPADAIARGRSGELVIIFPTRMTLQSLLDHDSAASLFAAAVDRSVEPVVPRFVVEDGIGHVYLPGDPTPHDP